MRAAVLDASVFIAACSPAEIHQETARSMMESIPENRAFLVPVVFRIEVISGFSRRGESAEFLDTVDALITGPRFHACPLDAAVLHKSVEIARKARTRAYDAVYAALAILREADLLTLDAELRKRLAEAYPAVTFGP